MGPPDWLGSSRLDHTDVVIFAKDPETFLQGFASCLSSHAENPHQRLYPKSNNVASDSQNPNHVLCDCETVTPSPTSPQKELQAEVPGVGSFSSLFISQGLLKTLAYLNHK